MKVQTKDLIDRLTTLAALKRLAKKIAKRDGVTHTQALELAAKQAGYENFAHARKFLP